jgi:hypothetical protein
MARSWMNISKSEVFMEVFPVRRFEVLVNLKFAALEMPFMVSFPFSISLSPSVEKLSLLKFSSGNSSDLTYLFRRPVSQPVACIFCFRSTVPETIAFSKSLKFRFPVN